MIGASQVARALNFQQTNFISYNTIVQDNLVQHPGDWRLRPLLYSVQIKHWAFSSLSNNKPHFACGLYALQNQNWEPICNFNLFLNKVTKKNGTLLSRMDIQTTVDYLDSKLTHKFISGYATAFKKDKCKLNVILTALIAYNNSVPKP